MRALSIQFIPIYFEGHRDWQAPVALEQIKPQSSNVSFFLTADVRTHHKQERNKGREEKRAGGRAGWWGVRTHYMLTKTLHQYTPAPKHTCIVCIWYTKMCQHVLKYNMYAQTYIYYICMCMYMQTSIWFRTDVNSSIYGMHLYTWIWTYIHLLTWVWTNINKYAYQSFN